MASGFNWVSIALPSIALGYGLVATSPRMPIHREAFGNGAYYLELAYHTNPRGVLSGDSSKAAFEGQLTGPHGDSPVHGVLFRVKGREIYRFQLPGGTTFEGELPRGRSCSRALRYRIRGPAGRDERGVLAAGFCP